MTESLTIRIDSALKTAIREIATSKKWSLNKTIEDAIEAYVLDAKLYVAERPAKMSQTRGYFEAIHPTAKSVAKPVAPSKRKKVKK